MFGEGLFRSILVRGGRFWSFVKIFGQFWLILIIFEQFWLVLVIFDHFWLFVVVFSRFGTTLFRSLWVSFHQFWSLTGHCNISWSIMSDLVVLNGFYRFWLYQGVFDEHQFWYFCHQFFTSFGRVWSHLGICSIFLTIIVRIWLF